MIVPVTAGLLAIAAATVAAVIASLRPRAKQHGWNKAASVFYAAGVSVLVITLLLAAIEGVLR